MEEKSVEVKSVEVYEVTKFVKTEEGFDVLGQEKHKIGRVVILRDYYCVDEMNWVFISENHVAFCWVRMEEISAKVAELNKKLRK